MNERSRQLTCGIALAVTAATLSIGCGGARPKLPEGLDLDQLIATENLAFFLEPRPEGIALAIDLDHAGVRMLTAHEGGQVLLWDASDGRAIAELAVHDGGAATAEFSPDGDAIATAGARDNLVSIWSAATGALIANCRAAAVDIAWSPDSARIAIASRTGNATLCDARTGELSGSLAHVAPIENDESSSAQGTATIEITAIAWSTDGEHVVTAGSAGVVSFWNPDTEQELNADLGHTGPVLDLAVGPQKDQIASAGDDGTVQILAPDRAEPVTTFYNESVPVRCIAFSADGGRLAWGGDDGRIKIWDAVSGEQLLAIEVHEGAVTDLAWSPDGGRVVSAGVDGCVR
ncbi:MAG: WD40 repeat domain-containing protein, partial [Deltaproteobacteria bacterium]|nr:WD40 repeat domain-containing protein [Deltaproteobacteria bacterium]